MSLNESQICQEVKDSLKEFNKLLEQSEKFANRFYEQMENFNSIKTIESGNKMETTEPIKQKESNIPVGEDIKSNINKQIKLGIRSILTKLRNEITSVSVNTNEDSEEPTFVRDTDSIYLTQEMRISNLINVFESNIDIIQETELIKSINESESGIQVRQESIITKSRNEIKSILEEYKKKNNELNEKCKHLEDKLSRENCQIFIYGKVSVGKSKIINAILGKEIFESTVAHTTSCFVKIYKSSDQYHHIEYRNGKYRYDKLNDLKNKIKEMSTLFSNDQNQLKTNELLSVYLNIPDNKILTLNTEIIDCPGSANKESITNYLKDKARNAHIFIFVLNNGITDEDEAFFQYQLEKSSLPIIFMLVNKWDLAYSDGIDRAERSKIAISKELTLFFKNKLHLPESDAKKQIFFVSAEDMYTKRNIKKKGFETPGYDERCRMFEEFENTLSQFINTLNENKLNHYKEELNKTRKTIIDYSEKFKTEFIKTNYLKNILVEWPNYKCELQESYSAMINYIEEKHGKLKKEMYIFFANCDNLNRDTISSLEIKLANLIKEGQIDFRDSKIDISEYIDREHKKHRRLTSIEKEKGEFSLKKILETDINLMKISDTFWESFCRTFTNVFKFLKDHFRKRLKEKDSDILQENQNIINEIIENLDNNASEYFKSLSEYLQKEIRSIINELDHKIKIYVEYLTNIENLLHLKMKC